MSRRLFRGAIFAASLLLGSLAYQAKTTATTLQELFGDLRHTTAQVIEPHNYTPGPTQYQQQPTYHYEQQQPVSYQPPVQYQQQPTYYYEQQQPVSYQPPVQYQQQPTYYEQQQYVPQYAYANQYGYEYRPSSRFWPGVATGYAIAKITDPLLQQRTNRATTWDSKWNSGGRVRPRLKRTTTWDSGWNLGGSSRSSGRSGRGGRR